MTYVYSIVTVIGIYSLLTLSLNLQFGTAGLVNFGMVAYFAVGAYTFAIVTQPPPTIVDHYVVGLQLSPWIGLVLGIAAAVAFAAATSIPALRLREDYLALVTFAFAQVLQSVLTNSQGLANGTLGLSNVQTPITLPAGSYDLWFMVVTLAILVVVYAAVAMVSRSPFGDVLRASRDDELATLALGKRVNRYRLKAFLLGGGIAGLAGVVYVWYTTAIAPDLIGADVTFAAFIALVVGGLGSNLGAVLGAAIFFGLEEGLKLIPVSPDTVQTMASVRVAVFGIVLIVVLRYRPGGLVGGLSRTRRRNARHVVQPSGLPAQSQAQPTVPSGSGG